MLPAQSVVFAFAVCLVAQRLRYKEPCYSNTATAVQQTDCKSKHRGLGGKHSVDLLGGCLVDWQCLTNRQVWTGLICTDCCCPLQKPLFIKQCQAKTCLAGSPHPLVCIIAEMLTYSFLPASRRQCGLLPCFQEREKLALFSDDTGSFQRQQLRDFPAAK